MTLLPQFQIEIFNSWLPFLFYFVSTSITSYIVNEKGYKRGGDICSTYLNGESPLRIGSFCRN